MRRFAVLLVLGCGGKPAAVSSPPVAPPPDAAPAPTPVATTPPRTCDQDPEITKHARPAYECAQDAMKRGEYDIADALAEVIMEKFPYSKIGVLSEIVRADVLFARGQYADAYAAYDRFVKFHPTHEKVPEVEQKRAEAKARSGQ